MAAASRRYSAVSIFLHWAIALLIVSNVVVANLMESAEGLAKFERFQLHKSIGLTVLSLSLARLAWRLFNPAPPLPAHMKSWERLLARATHVLFYVLIIGVPLAGWAAVSASPYAIPTLFWGQEWAVWPDLPLPRGEGAQDRFGDLHDLLVKGVYAVLALHVLGALKHHFLDRDDVLWRMLPLWKRRQA